MFKNDKETFKNIKQDTDNNILNKYDIHPSYMLKYMTFKILDLRNYISLYTNDNINEEYDYYNKIYTEINDIENESLTQHIQIPHNYNYLNEQQKKEHADKYNLSIDDIDMYIRQYPDTIN